MPTLTGRGNQYEVPHGCNKISFTALHPTEFHFADRVHPAQLDRLTSHTDSHLRFGGPVPRLLDSNIHSHHAHRPSESMPCLQQTPASAKFTLDLIFQSDKLRFAARHE
jgi:hypothetical protein